MKKALLVIVPLAGAAAIGVIVRRSARACSEEGQERPDIWARMEQKMPKTFPPRVMCDNIVAIRGQTTRILELLDQDAGRSAASAEPSGKAVA